MISFFVRFRRVEKIYAALFLFAFASSSLGQGGGLQSGAIIVLSSKGLVEVTDSQGKIITKTLKPGTVLTEGFTIRTGLTGEMSALFSNGMTATLERQTSLKISTFLQEPFQGDNQSVDQTEDELSRTTLALSLDMGSLIVESKKLNKDSSFQIQTSVGKAVIRGTEFQLSQQKGGTCKLDVSSSAVSFTSANNPQPTLIAEGQGMDASPDGTIMTRPIDSVAKINIGKKNQAAAKIASKISYAVLREAASKAKSIAPNSSGTDGSAPAGREKSRGSKEMEKSKEVNDGSPERDMRDSFLKQSKLNLRSASGSELISRSTNLKIRFYKDPKSGEILVQTLDRFGNILNSALATEEQMEKYSEEIGDGLSEDSGDELAVMIKYVFDPDSGEIIIEFLDKDENKLSSERISISDNLDINFLLDKLSPWVSEKDKTIDAIALKVFMQQLENGSSYDKGLNEALHSAIRLARPFLEPLTLPSDASLLKITNANDLKNQFTQNPYAYEFGLMLAEYGAFGEKYAEGQVSPLNIAENILKMLGGRSSLQESDQLNDLLQKVIKVGEVSDSGVTFEGEILGTRDINLGKEKNANLDLEISRIVGVGGSSVTIPAGPSPEESFTLDPSKAADIDAMNQVFSIVAAKDVIIEDSIHFRNSKNYDQAVVIGAADDIHFRAKSSIADYFEAEFLDQVFLSESTPTPLEHPDKITIKNDGSDFGIGSHDRLELINLDISTKGNLAIGSLDELKILSTRFDESTELSDNNLENVLQLNQLSAGTDKGDDSRVFLYAQNRISANGLGFGNNVREISMDAKTIDLKNVKFPDKSSVLLRSKAGKPTFGPANQKRGHVNFINNVYHGVNQVNRNFFSADEINSIKRVSIENLPKGESSKSVPAIRIRSHSP